MGNEQNNSQKSFSPKEKKYNPPPYKNNNIIKTTKKCPYCNMVYLYNTQHYINSYNSHVENCRKIMNSNQNLNRNSQMVGSLVLTNSLSEFINDAKKELPRGKKEGTR